MSYLLFIIYAVLLGYWVYRAPFFKLHHLPNWVPLGLLLIKVLAGFMVLGVYTFYYSNRASSDIFKYFDDGNIIFSALKQNPIDYLKMVSGIGSNQPHLEKYYDTCCFWHKAFNYGLINDNRIIIRLNALIRLVSLGNILIHSLFFSFISFAGFWALLRTFYNGFQTKIWGLILVIFWFPSALFWSSGMLKEAVLMMALGFLVHSLGLLAQSPKRILGWVLMVSTIFILLISKFYVLLAAIPAILFLWGYKFIGSRHAVKTFVAVHVLCLGLFVFSNQLVGINLPDILVQKQNDFIAYTNSLSHVGSKIDIPALEPGVGAILKQIPTALATVLFRPTLFESKNPMMLLAALENLMLYFVMVLAVVFYAKKSIRQPLFWAFISFTFILFTLSGITTPVLGALVRYKAPALPFLGMALLMLIDTHKLNSFIKLFMLWKK